jgi:hypothetical protein
VNSVIVAGRRRTRRRRLFIVGPVAGSAAAVFAIIAITLSTVGPSPVPGAPTVVQPAVTPPAPAGVAPVHAGETPAQTSRRLAAALTESLSAVLPGVELTEWSTEEPGVVVSHDRDRARYTTGTVLTTPAGQSQVDFVSWPGGRLPAPVTVSGWPADAPPPPVMVEAWFESCGDIATDPLYGQLECAQSVGPDGQTVVALTATCGADEGCPANMISAYHAWVTWTNAKVQVSVTAGTKRGGPPDPRVPPLVSLDQVVAIAADPKVTVAA